MNYEPNSGIWRLDWGLFAFFCFELSL
jgi:hypothetical protein